MSTASERELLRRPLAPGRSFTFATAETWRLYFLILVTLLATVIRLYGISVYPFQFDEYGSLVEARNIGLNWDSIIYSTAMHYWVRWGDSDMWLRLPAAIFGIASVPVLFKIGEKLGGARSGAVASLLAATSPFNIYHSQEVRFYSLFMLAAAAFMWATISYVQSQKSMRDRSLIAITGAMLLISHFLGLIAVYAQASAAFVSAKRRRAATVLAVVFGIPLVIFGLPIFPPIRSLLLSLYKIYGNALNADTTTTSVSLISFAKILFAGYALMFGYHVYPLRLLLVIPGTLLFGILLARGIARLSRVRWWIVIPLTYLIAVIGIYLVLDSVGGRVATGVSPRHVAFVWPAFIVLISLGLSEFNKSVFHFFLAAALVINAGSLWFGWQKDWAYGATADYRTAGAYLRSWSDKQTAVIMDGRAVEVSERYFPSLPNASRAGKSLVDQSANRRLLLVTNDWRPAGRTYSSKLLAGLTDQYSVIDGRVDYPLFQYVLERKSSPTSGHAVEQDGRVEFPLAIYPLEFQDLKLPATTVVDDAPLKVIGAYGLPDDHGETELNIPLMSRPQARKLVVLTNLVGRDQPATGTVAEVVVNDISGVTTRFPMEANRETASWSHVCGPVEQCRTVLQWHKRIIMSRQATFTDGWRDFQAGIHAAVFDLPANTYVQNLSIRYLSNTGHLYLWAVAVR